jgi:hypothetical protein
MKLPLVVRLSGTREEEGRAILRQHGIEPGVSAWEAAQKIVQLTLASPPRGEVARSAGGGSHSSISK